MLIFGGWIDDQYGEDQHKGNSLSGVIAYCSTWGWGRVMIDMERINMMQLPICG